MDVRFLVLLLLLASCMPQSQVSKGNMASTGNTGTTTGGTTGGAIPAPASATSWNYLSQNTNSITINVSNLNNAYVVGTSVEKYLGVLAENILTNFTGVDYCVVSDFSLGGVKHQLRSRAVPIAYYDFASKRVVRVLRVDFDDITNSTSLCAAPLLVQDQSGQYVSDPTAPATPVYGPSSLCPSCTSMLTSTKVRVFKRETGLSANLLEVPTPSINLGSLILQVDPNYNASGSAGVCTNTDCKARGFDCCLDNQCVKDGTPRPSATTTYAGQYQIAEQERIINPLAYINYPQIYYVCGTTVPTTDTGGTTTGGTSGGAIDYEVAFEQLKKDYKCVEHIKGQSTISPFHNELLARSFTSTTDCLTSSSDAGQTMYYQEVFKRLYTTCGCSKTTLSDMISGCPAYEYTVVLKDSAGEPTRIDCYTPPTQVIVPDIQSVSVNSRSAPHRFFESINGLEKDILGKEKTWVDGTTVKDYIQEGREFKYLDDSGVVPSQQNFSMNAVLGQMTVSLDKALPAKVVKVDIDKMYLISTSSGYYTPCPSCMKDSWLSTFTAFPSSSNGAGLQAIGHTTERDGLSTNYTNGNYEDTIFGRACWLPPTMIPFSHSSKGTVRDQRLNRLETQAALFINGYQRDWFGFNKGAMIGSFDGVTWFAIGKGRIVKSTSKKLFLAINAPFADLANSSLHVVQVQNFEEHTLAAQYDYDPEYHLSHPYQNEAGNCQANHMCATDTDCITKLGWEYVCADVKDMQTKWPTFDIDANEKIGEVTLTLDQILQQKRFPSNSKTKRCVYRGAGAPCIRNSGEISDLTKRKNLTCAPNFYCAKAALGSAHNSQIARWAANLEDIPVPKNHRFGKDANVLGRPLKYVTINEGASIPSNISSTLSENLAVNDATNATNNTGLCQPGKKLPSDSTNQVSFSNPFEQHKDGDSGKRTDYISQIASCNSALFTDYRYSSCPVLNKDGNYAMFEPGWTDIFSSFNAGQNYRRAREQNACGLDTLKIGTILTSTTADTLALQSPFKTIEAKPLSSGNTINDPTLVRDACLRKAGAVCHTDLDCSPNKYHADQVDYYGVDFFGNEAEQNYYREYLVCGQTHPKPFPSNAEAFKDYQMNKNRCCREVGKSFTTYSKDTPSSSSGTYEPATAGLEVDGRPGIDPTSPRRYTRLSVVQGLGTTRTPILTGNIDRDGNGLLTAPSTARISTPNQWRTLTEVNQKTCCGGGWIRKFSDGSTDWTKNNRLFIDPTNFKCLNSRTVLLTSPKDVISKYDGNNETVLKALLAKDFFNYCIDAAGAEGSCAQYLFSTQPLTPIPPVDNHYRELIAVDTGAPSFNNYKPWVDAGYSWNDNNNIDNYFQPRSADSDPRIAIALGTPTSNGRQNIHIQLPSFMANTELEDRLSRENEIHLNLRDSVGWSAACINRTSFVTMDNAPTSNAGCVSGDLCCYRYDRSTNNLKVVLTVDGRNHFNSNNRTGNVGAHFAFYDSGYNMSNVKRTKPGNTAYYLDRLGRLELSGIPQIGFEPVACNDNRFRIVPGIFKSEIEWVRYDYSSKDFFNSAHSFSSEITSTILPFAHAQGSTTLTVATSALFPPSGTVMINSEAVEYKSISGNVLLLATPLRAYHAFGAPVRAIQRLTTHHKLQSDPVFSSKDFKCCTPLGKVVSNQEMCCSGYGVPFGDGSAYTCKLPTGTDLMVYFNRFVSNEGMEKEGPGGGLDFETDFRADTGEPILSPKVNDKIRALGNEYCESGTVTTGGAFGEYEPEPVGPLSNPSNRLYNIVDSSRDNNQSSSSGETAYQGYTAFMDGFRWNHHLYCSDGD